MQRRYLTVSALNRYLKYKFDTDTELKNILIKAEISNFKRHSSGHFYFTLKDETSEISAIMFASNASKVMFIPMDGIKVLVEGYVSVYEARGSYQIYVQKMTQDGIGDLYLAYEELKNRLENEHYFDVSHKQAIVKYPKAIGVITSPTGAAVRDIIRVTKERYPLAQIIIYPALVQGVGAKESIVKQIQQANTDKLVDTLIVGRGGGSIEDLWAFNEEIVAKAIYQSTIPIISAVGHETDFTISDFVADVRAATPSQAALFATPDKKSIESGIEDSIMKAKALLQRDVQTKRNELKKSLQSFVFTNPTRIFQEKLLTSDHLRERLMQNGPEKLVQMNQEKNHQLIERLNQSFRLFIERNETKTIHSIEKLELSNPLNIMKKGFAVVKKDTKIITSVDHLNMNDEIQVMLSDGELNAEVKSIKKGDSLWKKN